MNKYFFIILIAFFTSVTSYSQKIDSIYFNLYTDSLKKGTFNYINVDGYLPNDTFIPLTENELEFYSSCGKWKGNCIFLDSTVNEEKVRITATLKTNPVIKKEIVMYIKKVDEEPELMSEKEIMEMYRRNSKSRQKSN